MADKEKIMKMTKMMVRSVVMSEKEGVLMDNLVSKLVLYNIFKCSVFILIGNIKLCVFDRKVMDMESSI